MSKTSKHIWIVDVVEDGSASIEVDGRTVTPIPEWMLPQGVKAGDVLSAALGSNCESSANSTRRSNRYCPVHVSPVPRYASTPVDTFGLRVHVTVVVDCAQRCNDPPWLDERDVARRDSVAAPVMI